MNENLHYGSWTHDQAGLPCFDASLRGAVERPFLHGFSSGRLNVLVNRWGLVHLFTTEGGYTDFSANIGRVRSGLFLELIADGAMHTLVYGDLHVKTGIRYGIGYAVFTGAWHGPGGETLELSQIFFSFPDRKSCLAGAFKLKNSGHAGFRAQLRIRADVEPKAHDTRARELETGRGYCLWKDFYPGLGNYQLRADASFHGTPESEVALLLERELVLAPGESLCFTAQVGYGVTALPTVSTHDASGELWAKRLGSLKWGGMEDWMSDEAVWSLGQLYSFESYDSSVSEHYLNLGGYGWPRFGVREVPETAMTVAAWDPELAFSCLRWTAKLQYTNGDLPQCHAFHRPTPGEIVDLGHQESDNEIWFVMACAEVMRITGKTAFLDEEVPFWEREAGTILEHLRRAVKWIREGIGTGAHGLIRMADGDWNDYLSGVGRGGFGESMMNTGMACFALSRLVPILEHKDPDFAAECREFVAGLRLAAGAGFDHRWFVRGYTDKGEPFGTVSEDRLFLNAQSWCVLGRCGTRQMRETAMRSALERCNSPLGLTLMSRPYSCPPPPEVSLCPIPAGDGENAGIWPQTVHWAIWALTELGWKEEAMVVWKKMSLRNHARLHPETPFGIFNGPDCYSSHFGGEREGWTQVELMQRSDFPPMNPMVAWQAFSLRQIAALQQEE